MATSKGYQHGLNENLARILECNICLDRLTNPKILDCTHAFCKCCLDSIIQFQADGSGVIVCPLRCAGKTEIGRNLTTNELKAPLQFKNLMDMLAEESSGVDDSEQKYKCSGSPNCKQSLSYHCCTCSATLCNTCKGNHHHGNEVIDYITIKSYQGELHPWCAKHASVATYACQCGFICMYCKQRECAKHIYEEITVSTERIVNWVHNQETRAGDTDKVKEIKALTEVEFKVIKDKVTKELKNRKIKWLSSNLKMLNADEERIYGDLERLKAAHFQNYPAPQPRDYIMNKPGYQIILNRQTIHQNINNSLNNNTLPQLNVSLSEYNLQPLHPLGEIVQNQSAGRMVANSSIRKTVTDQVKQCDVNEDIKSSLIKGLEDLFQQAFSRNEMQEPTTGGKDNIKGVTSGTQCYRVVKRKEMVTKDIPSYAWTDGEPTSYEVEVYVEDIIPYEKSYGAEYLIKKAMDRMDMDGWKFLRRLCEFKSENLFIELIKVRQEKVFDKRDDLGQCPIHWAAMFGCVKLLLYILQNEIVNVDDKGYRNKSTALHCAALYNKSGCVEVLIAYRADLKIVNEFGTALDIARNKGHRAIIEILEEVENPKDDWQNYDGLGRRIAGR